MSNTRQIPKFKKIEFKKKQNKYCLVIPVLNEGEKFKKEITSLSKHSTDIDILIADGGSTDGSNNKKFLEENGVRTLLIKTGKGKLGAQYRMAYSYALDEGYEGVVNMDGNNKDGPEAIPRFLKELDKGYDYIQGSRYIKGGKALNTPTERYYGVRYILSPILSFGAGKMYTDTSNGFRAYSRRLLDSKDLKLFRDELSHYEILFYVTARANRYGLKTKEIPVTRKYPAKGKTPTKIKGIKSNFSIIREALKASFGYYDPK